jgi:hypothetical protein
MAWFMATLLSQVGTALLPGSTSVYDRFNNVLVECQVRRSGSNKPELYWQVCMEPGAELHVHRGAKNEEPAMQTTSSCEVLRSFSLVL